MASTTFANLFVTLLPCPLPGSTTISGNDYYVHGGPDASIIGVQKNYNPGEASWRCWTIPGSDKCGPTNNQNTVAPALKSMMVMSLPVLTNFDPMLRGPTPQARELLGWARGEIRNIESPGVSIRWNRTVGFIAASIDFGGSLGVQNNVLVIEEMSAPEGQNGLRVCSNPGQIDQGTRFERYYFVQGYGRVDSFGVNWSGECGKWASEVAGVRTAFISGYQLPDDSYNPRFGSYNVIDWW